MMQFNFHVACAEVDARYKDWYLARMRSAETGPLPEAAADYAFVGLTDFYRTSLCLFYFSMQVRSGNGVARSQQPETVIVCLVVGETMEQANFAQLLNMLMLYMLA